MGSILVVSREHSRIARPSTVFLQEDGTEVLVVLLLSEVRSDVVPIKLGYERCNWDRMFQRWDEVVPTPVFKKVARKSLVVLRLTSQPLVVVLSGGEFSSDINLGR